MNLPFSIDLENKVAVITGAGGVICSGFAKALAECKAKVALLDINTTAAQKVVDEITAAGGKAIAVEANCLKSDSLAAAHETVVKTFGECDILINGAGGNNPRGTTDNETMTPDMLDSKDLKTFFELDPDGIRFVFDLNVVAAVLTTQAFAKDMVKKGGTILNVSSMNAFRPLTKIPAYSAAKAAVSNLTQWLAVHFAPCGIRVNAIAPGFFVTNQNRDLLFKDGKPTARTEKILRGTPMNRFGETDDLTGTLLWLCSEKASGFVTGVVVPVDGGFAAYSGV